jgi:serine/threonine protein phosphatase PrpC
MSSISPSKKKYRPYRLRNSSNVLKYSEMSLNSNKEKLKEEIKFNLSINEFQNQSHREYMEDFTLIHPNLDNDPQKTLFCLFDGHGGTLSAEICKNNIAQIFTENLSKNNGNIAECFLNTFNELDSLCLKEDCIEIGNTATVIFIDEKNLYCANVGDSRAVVIYNESVINISYDDNLKDEKEKNRILKENGVIKNKKLNGILSITRAIGDFDQKKNGLICVPHLNKREICYNDKFVIVASDGIWDVVTNEMLLNVVHRCKNCEEIAKKIVNLAINLESKDNISCIVIGFHEEESKLNDKF